MTIHEIDESKVKKLVSQMFSDAIKTLLFEHSVFTHCYAVQLEHSEVDTFMAIAKSVEKYFASSVTISLYDAGCVQEDCEKIEQCIEKRSSYHEMRMDSAKETGMITIIAASLVSPQMQQIDYFTHFLKN